MKLLLSGTFAAIVVVLLVNADAVFAATLCFFNYELASTGLTKVCVYDCLGSPAAITIQSYQYCPLSIHQ